MKATTVNQRGCGNVAFETSSLVAGLWSFQFCILDCGHHHLITLHFGNHENFVLFDRVVQIKTSLMLRAKAASRIIIDDELG